MLSERPPLGSRPHPADASADKGHVWPRPPVQPIRPPARPRTNPAAALATRLDGPPPTVAGVAASRYVPQRVVHAHVPDGVKESGATLSSTILVNSLVN